MDKLAEARELLRTGGEDEAGRLYEEVINDLSSKLSAALAENDATVARAAKLAVEWAEIEASLQSRLDAAAKNDEERVKKWASTVARVEEERDAALRRLDSIRDYCESEVSRDTAEVLKLLGGVVERLG